MKYISLVLCAMALVAILFVGSLTSNQQNSTNSQYLRIHIRANSNQDIDQNIKYKIKDAVVDALIPVLANCLTKEEAYNTMQSNLHYIENVANDVLRANNFNYASHAKLANENFPTRAYGDLTLESGFYDALILELGNGSGDNWWCVVYPPLCFVNGSTNVSVFKSRIIEIVNNFFK